jgi:branched-chain amino acid transport system ATP-binding protein
MDVVRELADRIIVLHNGTLVADGDPAEVIASPVVQEAYLGVARRPHEQPMRRRVASPASGGRMSDALLTLEGRAHPHRGVPHPARRGPRRAARPAHHAAGAQRRGQDDHAAHHHGPVAGIQGAHPLQRQDITRTAHAADRGLNIAYVPENMGIFADLTVRENMLLAARTGASAEQMDASAAAVDLQAVPGGGEVLEPPGRQASGGQKQMLAVARAIVEPRDCSSSTSPARAWRPPSSTT